MSQVAIILTPENGAFGI